MEESDNINDEDFMAGLQAELGPVEPSKGLESSSGGAPKPKPKQTSQGDDDGGLFGSKDDGDDDGDDDDDDDDGLEDAEISMGDEGDTGAKGGAAPAKGAGKSADGDAGGKDAQTTDAGGPKVRGLEDSAATRRGAAPAASPVRGLEDSAANRKGGTPETMRDRYGGTEEEVDQGKGGSGTQGSKISPFSALGATTATTADDGDRPGVNVLTEPSIACGGVSAAEQDSKDVGSGGDGPPGAEDSFDLTPSPARPSAAQSVKSLQQPFKAVQQQQQQQQQDQQQPAFRKPPTLLTETYSLDMDGTGSRPGTAVPPPGASETPRQGRIDVDLGGQGGAAQAAKRKELEDRQAARYKKEAPKGITAEDFANQEALDQLRGMDQKTGLTLPSVLELFQTYDQDRTGAINIVEFKDMLTDLDGLKSIDSTQGKAKSTKTKVRGGRKEPEESPEDRYVRHEFERADLNGDQLVSIDEFYIYFYSTLCFKFPMLRTGVNPGADLLNIYMKYCSFGKGHRSEEMDCSQFAKLCHESGLLNGKTVTKATCDIVWFRARAELESLEAFKKKQNEYITPKMLYPQFLFALLYIAEKRRSGLQEVVSRILEKNSPLPMPSSADYLFRKNTGAAEQSEEYLERPRGLPRAPPNPMTLQMSERMRVEAELSKTLRRGTYDKEAGNLTTPRASCRRANGDASASHEQDEDHEKDDNCAKDGGLEPIRYGGAAGNRVPTKGPLAEGKNVVSAQRRSQWGLEPKEIKLSRHGAQALNDPVVLLEVHALKPDELIMGCRDVFTRFNQWEGGSSKSQMDKARFVKCIRDAQLITEAPGCLTQTLVEDFFTKVLPPAQNTINFMRFVDALRHVATKLRTSLNYVMERLVVLGEPVTGLYLPTAADGRANADVRKSAAK